MIPVAIPIVDLDSSVSVVTYGGNRLQPLPALKFADGTIVTEWELSDDERVRLVRGERIRLWIRTGHQPLQPVMLEVTAEDRP